MAKMIIPVTAKIGKEMISQIRFKVKKSFTGISWQEVLLKRTQTMHLKKNLELEEEVHWKMNYFMLPSGAAGKRYIEDVTRPMKL